MPVVIAWPREKKDRSGVHMLGGLRQLHPRDLGLYLTSKKKFEAIYGPTDADEKELLFVIQLADALAAKSLPRVKKVLIQWIGPTEADKAMH